MADSEPISRSYYIRSDSTGKLENIKVIFDLPGGVQTEGRFRLRPPGVPASQAPHRTQHAEYGAPGKGQFLLTLAARNPQINYVGIERYSSVLLRAVEKLTSDEPDHAVPENIRFLCIDATMLPQIFSPGEVSRIYLNFSDPWPKARHAGRRLTSKEFFARYDRILAADGQVEFKTDNRRLFDFSAEQLESSGLWEITALTYDLHHDKAMNENNIMTEYEEKFSSYGNPICKLITERKSNRRTCI